MYLFRCELYDYVLLVPHLEVRVHLLYLVLERDSKCGSADNTTAAHSISILRYYPLSSAIFAISLSDLQSYKRGSTPLRAISTCQRIPIDPQSQ